MNVYSIYIYLTPPTYTFTRIYTCFMECLLQETAAVAEENEEEKNKFGFICCEI